MSAPTLIKITSATFGGTALVGAQTASIEFGGSEQTARGDGAIAEQIAYVEGIRGKVTVNCLQGIVSTTPADLLPRNASLVINGFTQAPGSGALGGGSHTWTFPNATMNKTTRGSPLDGSPSMNFDFTCVAASGLPTDIFSVS